MFGGEMLVPMDSSTLQRPPQGPQSPKYSSAQAHCWRFSQIFIINVVYCSANQEDFLPGCHPRVPQKMPCQGQGHSHALCPAPEAVPTKLHIWDVQRGAQQFSQPSPPHLPEALPSWYQEGTDPLCRGLIRTQLGGTEAARTRGPLLGRTAGVATPC